MNAIASFRKCNLSNSDLLQKIDCLTDEIFETQKIPARHIPARPNSDYDLLIGELLLRFTDKWIETETMPDFDGEYLCYIVRKNECGTVSNYQRVINCKMNKWMIPNDDYSVTHWMNLPAAPKLQSVSAK